MAKTERQIITEEQALNSMVQSMYDGFASMRQLTEVLNEELPKAIEVVATQARLVLKSSEKVEVNQSLLQESASRIMEMLAHTSDLKSYIDQMEETVIKQGQILSELMLVKDNPQAVTELLGSIATIIVNFDQYLSSSERIVSRALSLAHPATKEASIKLLSIHTISEWNKLFNEAAKSVIIDENENPVD